MIYKIIKMKKMLVLCLLLSIMILPFQNCANTEFTALNQESVDAEVPEAIAPEVVVSPSCIPISSADELINIKNGRSGLPLNYCFTQDIDLTGVDLANSSIYLRNVILDGKNFKILGLKLSQGRALFSDVDQSTIKNLTIGDTDSDRTVKISNSPSGILAIRAEASTLENIKIINPINAENTIGINNCSLFVHNISISNLKSISILITENLTFNCASVGLFSSHIKNDESNVLNDISIKSEKNITANLRKLASLFIITGSLSNIKNVNISVQAFNATANADTKNIFGSIMAVVSYRDGNKKIDLENIQLKANLNLRNYSLMGLLMGYCGESTDDGFKTFNLKNFSIDSDTTLNNFSSTWRASHSFGQICGTTGARDISFTDGYINSRFSLTGPENFDFGSRLSGLLAGWESPPNVYLSLIKNSNVYFYTPAAQASKINKDRYYYNPSTLNIDSLSESLNVFYNDSRLN